MKKIISLTLTLLLVLGTVPLKAQEITISREQFIDTSTQIDKILSKEFNNYTIKNPEAAYKEYRDILKEKSKQYNPDQAKTYRDKQTYRNRAFMPYISPKEKYPNSTYFKKEGDFYRYAIAARNAALETKTPLGYEDFQNHAENEMRRMFLQESKDENVLKEINLNNKRSPINDASYLAGYYAQNLAFTEAVREANLTLRSSDCQSPESKKDKDCIDAGILGQYDYKLFESANQNIIKHISTIAPKMNRCLSQVLAPLQAKKIALQEIEDYLDEHSNLPWAACGVDYEEAKELILDNTLTRADAEDMIDNQGFGAKLLGTLDYISLSYYVNRASAIEDFKMGEEDQFEDMSNAEIYREAQISDILSNSLNKVLTQIASNYITYGQVFYYDVESFSGKSDKFAEGWHAVSTNEIYQNMPIAKLAQNAIARSGRRGYQDKTFAKSMQEVRFESNAKSQVEILMIAADFVMDPTMLLAPIGETVKGLKLASKVAKVAPKTTGKVKKAAETVGKGVQFAKNAVTDTKVGRGVKKAAEPVRNLKSKTGKFVGDAFDDWSDMGKHLDDVKAPKTTPQTTGIEDFAKTTPTPKPEPKTALDPDNLDLTKEFDEALEKSKLGLLEKRSSVPERYKEQIDDILEQINKAKADSSLTPDQRRVVDEATEYFNSLTPENLADGNLYNSPKFRENAAKLRSPNATEHGFFIDASGGESYILMEQGYIPHILFSEGDLPFNDIKKMFKGAQKTDKPIFVRLQSHGEIDASGKFYFILGDGESKNVIYTNDLVEALQSLRTTTGTPEINLYSGACHSGQFLDEFVKLPVEQRKGINIFATAGSPLQVNVTSNVNLSRIRGASGTIKEDQLDNIIEIIRTKGNIFTRAYVDGEIFDPLGQALLRSKADPKYAKLTDKLEILNRFHTSTDVKVSDLALDYQFDAHGYWYPQGNSFAAASNVFDTECRAQGLEDDIIEFVHETALQMRKGKRW